MAGFDHRIILAGQTPDIVDTFNKSYDVGRKRAIEDQAIERSNRLNESINSWDKSKPLSQHLIESGFADEGYNYAKKDAEVKKLQGDATKSDYENRLKMIDIAGRATQELLAHPALSKDAVKQKADEYFQAGLTTPEMYQKQINMIPSLPDDPAQLRKHIESQVMGLMEAKEQMKYQRPDANAQLNAQTQMRNQDLDYSLGQQNYSLNSRKADFDNQLDMSRFNLDKQDKEFKQGLDLNKFELEQQKRRDALNPQAKMGEAQKKQVIGVQNTRNAITEYRDQLKKFGVTDLLSPDARAEMGTKYNNMMLQAKEAYNLGVLNGPDFKILQSVITDPRSFMGSITSKSALDKQASELDRIMKQIGEVAGGNLSAPREGGASDGWDDGHVTMQAQKLGTDPAKVKAFLEWKASQGR